MPGLKIKKKTMTRYHVTSKIIIILIYAVNIFLMMNSFLMSLTFCDSVLRETTEED